MDNEPIEVWRVLLVDDDEDDYLLTRSMLNQAQGRKVELDWASSYDAGQQQLQSNHYHVVLVDYDLGPKTGIKLIRESVAQGCPAPLILFTGRGSYEVDVEAMQAGATLYLTKTEANPLLLERSLRYAIERKRIEEELRSIALFQDENPSPIMRISAEGEILYANLPSRTLLSNRSCDQELGLPETVRNAAAEALKTGATRELDLECGDKIFSFVIAPIQDQGYVNLYGRDITERIRAREALLEANELLQEQAEELEVQAEELKAQTEELATANEQLCRSEEIAQHSLAELRSIYAAAPVGLCFLDQELRYRAINKTLARINGLSVNAHIGKTLREVVKPEVADAVEPLIRQVLETGEPVLNREITRWSAATPDRPGDWLVSYHPVCSEDGSLLGVSCVMLDITDQKAGEKALRQSEATYRAIARNFPDGGVFVIDRSLRLIVAEGAAMQRMGFSRQAIEGRTLDEVLEGEELERVKERCRRTLAGELQSYETNLNGLNLWAQYVPLRNEDDQVVAAMVVTLDVSERKASEEMLRRYELLAAYSRDIILFMDRHSGRILEANAAAEQAYGYDREELLSLKIQDLRAPGTRSLTAEQMARADAEGILFETSHQRNDGSTFPVEVSSRGATISGKRTLISVVRDITKRQEAEEALRRSQQDLARAQVVAHTGSWRINVRGNELVWSDETYRMLEIPIGTPMTYEKFLAVVYPDDREFLDSSWSAALGGEIYDIEHRILVGGKVKWVRERAELEFDAEGELLGGFGIVHDITERKEAEIALRDSEERYKSLFNGMTEGFAIHEIITDETGTPCDYRFLDINPAFERLTGLKREDVVGKTHNEILAGNDPEWVRIYGEVALTGEPVHFENYSTVLKKHYEVFSYRPAPRQFAVIFMDVTERKNAEFELAQANAALQTYAEQLKRSNLALEDFAFIASHDLREPLRKVQAFGDLLKSRYTQGLDERAQDYIDRMQSAAGRMQSMLDGLLTYARITTQGQAFKQIDLNQVAAEVLVDLEMRLGQTGGRVELGKLPLIEADPVQIRQLLQNLLGNALKFHRPGVAPQISLKSNKASNRTIELIVEDNGIGFEMGHARNLFKPFHRLNERSDYEGTGMGLAICRKIVERHGGSISATSIPGKGATFIVTLPCMQCE